MSRPLLEPRWIDALMEPPSDPRPAPGFSPGEWAGLYRAGRHDELSERLLALIQTFETRTYHHLDPQGQRFLDTLVGFVLDLFRRPDYVPRRDHALAFVRLNPTLSNLVALTRFETSDSVLAQLPPGPEALAKRLTLCSARNAAIIDRRALFDADPELASVWYGAYARVFNAGLIRPGVVENLREHFRQADDRLDLDLCPLDGYFAATYCGGDCDRVVKGAINRAVRRVAEARGLSVRNRPDPRKIAVVSGNWSPGHSVYRITRAFVESLAGVFDLTLVLLGGREADTRLFSSVVRVDRDPRGALDVGPLLDNTFGLVYFPDVGLTESSILLANLRLAPVQVASMGHSVSTFGAAVDYWISGVEAEAPDRPERHYSERLVLLPGSGAVHERPDHTPTGLRPTGPGVVLNCPWNAQKLTAPFARTLAALIARSRRPITLRLFVNRSLDRRNDYLPFVRDVEQALGPGVVEVCRGLSYREYMTLMEQGDLTIDSFPFGGCNTVADSLFLRKLTVTLEGDRWYNRIGSQMVRAAGLPELVATSESEYLDIISTLIDDPDRRASSQARLDVADLDATVFRTADAPRFAEALAYLIVEHERLKRDPDRSPIRIGC